MWRRWSCALALLGCEQPGAGGGGYAATGPTTPPSAPLGEAPPAVSPSAVASAAPGATASAKVSAAPSPSGPCPDGAVLLAGGTFVLKESKRQVTVGALCLDRLEVVVKDYAQCVRDKKCSPRCLQGVVAVCRDVPADADWPDRSEMMRASRFCNGGIPGRESHPLNCASFKEAKAYCAYKGGRLPSEAEWEWAARGREKANHFPWGMNAPLGLELCWGKPRRRDSTCLPGSFDKDTTADGVRDMAGSLSEWVTQVDKDAPTLRGASWFAVDDGYIRASIEGFDSTSSRSEVFGFRCAYAPRP